MREWEKELKEIRFLPAMRALIPVHEQMGIPRFVEENIMYIPFLKVCEGVYMLASKVYLEYPNRNIIRFEKIRNGKRIKQIAEDTLRLFKKQACDCAFCYGLDKIPEQVRFLYDEKGEITE